MCFLLIDKILQFFLRFYRVKYFQEITKCKSNGLYIIGKINVINKNIKYGKNLCLYPDIMFFGDGEIIIGDNVTIGNGTIIYSSKEAGVVIGNNVQIAAQSYIIDVDHSVKAGDLIRNQSNTYSRVSIGNDVWIAANSTILKGSIIEDGAIVGAKSLVKNIIPSNSIAVGIPAKVIKYRE